MRNLANVLATIFMLAALVVGVVAQSPSLIVTSVAWSPDGTKVAVAYGTGRYDHNHPEYYAIQIFNADMTQVLQNLTGSQCGVLSIDWNFNGSKLAAATQETFGVHVWNVQTGQLIMTDQEGGQG